MRILSQYSDNGNYAEVLFDRTETGKKFYVKILGQELKKFDTEFEAEEYAENYVSQPVVEPVIANLIEEDFPNVELDYTIQDSGVIKLKPPSKKKKSEL